MKQTSMWICNDICWAFLKFCKIHPNVTQPSWCANCTSVANNTVNSGEKIGVGCSKCIRTLEHCFRPNTIILMVKSDFDQTMRLKTWKLPSIRLEYNIFLRNCAKTILLEKLHIYYTITILYIQFPSCQFLLYLYSNTLCLWKHRLVEVLVRIL